jgi:multidrug efflux system outer membrane protein
MKKYFLPILIAGCTLAPKYETPKSPIAFQDSSTEVNQIKLVRFEEFFLSKEMQSVIQMALENNRDLKLAVLNIEKLRIKYNIKKSELFPNVDLEASYLKSSDKAQYSAGFSVAYEIDFFGKIQSLKNASLAEFLAEKENKKIVEIFLISEVVNLYLEAIKNKQNLLISEEILDISNQNFEIINAKYNKGYISKQELNDAISYLEENKILYTESKKNFNESKNNLSLLVGKDIKDENLLASFEDISFAENLLNEVPSSTLLKRPDIKKAEQMLIASNANIGAARAAFFPSVSLTGFTGYASDDLNNLFKSNYWEFNPKITLPIFTGGLNKANLDLANLRKQESIILYEKAIENAFYESLNAINLKSANKLSSDYALNSTNSKLEKHNIYKARYSNGIETKEMMLKSHIEYLKSLQNTNEKRNQYYMSIANLYKVFGGGSEIN